MILVDTSIWNDHLRAGNERLSALLVAGQVLSHPFVIGELALGNLVHRTAVIGAMQDLPQIRLATEAEVLHAIITRHWYGQGIGYTGGWAEDFVHARNAMPQTFLTRHSFEGIFHRWHGKSSLPMSLGFGGLPPCPSRNKNR